jgi:hypothetical protein
MMINHVGRKEFEEVNVFIVEIDICKYKALMLGI